LFLILSVLILSGSNQSHAQKRKVIKDSKLYSIFQSEEHSPQKAAIYSTLIPGWGQAYNKKYWKAPIVWAGVGTVAYFIYSNNSAYHTYLDYYVDIASSPDTTIVTGTNLGELTYSSLGGLYTKINESRSSRDLYVIVLFAVWGLNIIDANVDAHFFNFDIGEDLSLNLKPTAWITGQRKQAYGLNLVLNLY